MVGKIELSMSIYVDGLKKNREHPRSGYLATKLIIEPKTPQKLSSNANHYQSVRWVVVCPL